jgi:hypothetical protein
MRSILRALVCVTMMAAGLATAAQADDVWAKWADTIRLEIKQNQASVAKMSKEFRDARCPHQATAEQQSACVAAYNMVIALMNLKQTQLEIKVIAASLPSAQRDQMIQKASTSFDELNKQAVALADQTYLQFPVPQQSSQPVR